MSYLNRVCMAASVTVVRDHSDSGAKSLSRLGLLAVAGRALGGVAAAAAAAADTNRAKIPASVSGDDSVRKAMFISCWTPS